MSGHGSRSPQSPVSSPQEDGPRSTGSSDFRVALLGVLVYTALAFVPVKMPIPEMLPEPPYVIVQPVDGPDPDLDELVAALGLTL